jgi:hypothetical protein
MEVHGPKQFPTTTAAAKGTILHLIMPAFVKLGLAGENVFQN